MAVESWLKSDQLTSSIIKILEKYGVLEKWVLGSKLEEWFRGKWVTLTQEKRSFAHVLIDWKHQELLEKEAYDKLAHIKKMLFQNACRKKYILSYFGDEQDLKKIEKNCGMCDICTGKSQHTTIRVPIVWEVRIASRGRTSGKSRTKKEDTYTTTLMHLKEWKNILEIAKERSMWITTIESHVVELYISKRFSLVEILKHTDLSKIKIVKHIIDTCMQGSVEKLRPLKEELEKKGYTLISYWDIKVTLAMIEKRDI
jgi:superfamily II DNA helicase RecQ